MEKVLKIKSIPWTFDEAVEFLKTRKALVRKPSNIPRPEHQKRIIPNGIKASYTSFLGEGDYLVWHFMFGAFDYVTMEGVAEDFVTEDGLPCVHKETK